MPARAWVVAAALSGAPSTACALATGRDPLEAARAAGTLLPGRWRTRGGLAAGLVAHAAVSAFWTAVLAAVLPSCRRPVHARRTAAAVAEGAAAGLAIAALDLGLVARRLPAVRRLPQLPQWADHVAFGALAAAVLAGGRDPSAAGRP